MKYQVNNISLHVEDKGKNSPALLFVHFWGGSSRTWTEVSNLLSDRYRTIAYDQRGWGASDKPDGSYDIKTLASDTLALIDKLNLENFVLIGHSMGGKVAQYVAAQQPKGLSKLILVAPAPATPTIYPPQALDNMRIAYTTEEGINNTINQIFQAGDLAEGIRRRTVEDMKKHTAASRTAWPNGALSEDVSQGISTINVPTLIIGGEKDVVDTPAKLENEVKIKIPDSSLVIVPQVGHLVMLQAPEKVASLIDDFVKQN